MLLSPYLATTAARGLQRRFGNKPACVLTKEHKHNRTDDVLAGGAAHGAGRRPDDGELPAGESLRGDGLDGDGGGSEGGHCCARLVCTASGESTAAGVEVHVQQT
jgi:hypothetical protein